MTTDFGQVDALTRLISSYRKQEEEVLAAAMLADVVYRLSVTSKVIKKNWQKGPPP